MAMSRQNLETASRHLRDLFGSGVVGDLGDGQLVERFARHGDESAFEVLVRRHGPMVLRVCEASLGDPHAAQDAFQATFLILVRKAGSIRRRDSVASWLYGVALRVSAESRASAARRRAHESRAAEMAAKSSPGDDESADLGTILREEIGRLPEKYRAPVLLCHLEGLTHEEAARQLCWPVGTVRSRLARARDRLRPRLEKRGLSPSPAVLLPCSPLAEALIQSTIRAASAIASGVVPATVALLTEGTMRTMFFRKTIKLAATSAIVVGLAAVAFALARPDDPPKPNVAKEIPLPTRAEVRDALKSWWDSMETLSFRERTFTLKEDRTPDRAKSVRTFEYAHAPGDRRLVRHGWLDPKGEDTFAKIRLDDGRREYLINGGGNDPRGVLAAGVVNQTDRGDRYEGLKSDSLWLFMFAEEGFDSRPYHAFVDRGAPLEITRDAAARPLVVLRLKRMGRDVAVELDPQHGYLPRKLSGFLDFTVTRFAQDNGIWFPAEGLATLVGTGKPDQRFEVLDLKINRKLPPEMFLPRPEWKLYPTENLGDFGPATLGRAREDPKAPGTVDALIAIVSRRDADSATALEAMDLLLKNHVDDPRIDRATESVAASLARGGSEKPLAFLRGVAAKSPDRKVRAWATLRLARSLKACGEAMHESADQAAQDIRESTGLFHRPVSPSDIHAQGQSLMDEAERLWASVIAEYADVDRLAEQARADLADLRLFSIGATAMEIQGNDLEGEPFKLSHYRGKVVVLTFWENASPLDRAEYDDLKKLAKDMEGRPFALLGVNNDKDRQAALSPKFPGRSWFDGAEGPIARAWKRKGRPMTYVLDARGKIRLRNSLPVNRETAVKALLEELKAAK